ncbi:MAG: hypothetical protein JWL85_842 [Candidatus Saccharibacteria bacterium]|nr:hypothetical protein [Candidatus Saccharibacteria bacterium]
MDPEQARVKLETVFNSGKEQKFARHRVILLPGEEPEQAYWISEGFVKVVSYNKNGNERLHYIYGPQEIFPVTSLFGPVMPQISFVALNDVTLRTKSIKDFHDTVDEDAEMLKAIIRQMTTLVERVYSLHLDTAEERVAHGLLTLAGRFGVSSDSHVVLNLPLTQQEFGDTVRLSRETTGRILNRLEEQGHIILGRKHIRIYPDRLQKFMDDLG